MSKTINFANEGSIDGKRAKTAVYSRIDFELPVEIWNEIEIAFADCWNNIIGLRGQIYENQLESYVYNHLKTKRIILDIEKVIIIVDIISDYIRMTRGYLDKSP